MLNKTTTVSGPQWSQPWPRRVLLFQSYTQFTSLTIIVAGISLLMQQLFAMLGGAVVPPVILVLAAAVGAVNAAVYVLPGCMSITTTNPFFNEVLAAHLFRLGYREGVQDAGELLYRQKLPDWLLWRESDVRVAIEKGNFSLIGPYLTLNKLTKSLKDG